MGEKELHRFAWASASRLRRGPPHKVRLVRRCVAKETGWGSGAAWPPARDLTQRPGRAAVADLGPVCRGGRRGRGGQRHSANVASLTV